MKTGVELIKEFEIWVRDQGKSENTVTTYRGVLQKFYQWLIEGGKTDISEITQEDVQDYMEFLDKQENRSASTIDKVFATIRVLAQFLEKDEIVKNVQKKEKEKNIYQTIPEFLKESEQITLLKKVEQDGNLRNTAIVYTLLHTGIRISELCKLNYSDIEINGEEGSLIVRDVKGKQQRVIPFTKELIVHLKRYIDSLEVKGSKVFVSKGNEELSTRAVQYMLNSYDINPNRLRHTFCKDLLNNGVELEVVAQLAGHKDLNMTKRYLRSS